MDRLPVVALFALFTACDGPTSPPPPPAPTRVEAVAASPKTAADTNGFCDEKPNQPFAYPQMAGSAPVAPQSGWRWINVWATWCGPCVEELPRLAAWERKLNADGLQVDVQFLSADDTDDAVAKFRTSHPGMPESSRIQEVKDASSVMTWLPTLGVKTEAVLPVQLFVDPQGVVRCARMGSLSDTDYDNVKAVLEGK